MATKIHIICFDVPYPADYGGAIDLFYKIKALAAAGCELYVHCYEYGRGTTPELEKYCRQVWYYPRRTGWSGLSAVLPYIIYSRRNKKLLERLLETDAPILFEGLHTTYYLSHQSLHTRYKAIRVHNIESEYYEQLFKKESSFFVKSYYKAEAYLLKQHEQKLKTASAFFEISLADCSYFKGLYPAARHTFIPPFHPYNEVTAAEGSGSYCLYHGNLSHPENREAALYLLTEVFPPLGIPLVIAGKSPGRDIIAACGKLPDCKLIADPGADEMAALIKDAHIHVLPTFQQSGMKLKLLHALFGGRHVLANDAMLHGTGLEHTCTIANNPEAFMLNIQKLMRQPFTELQKSKRQEQLKEYDNMHNARKLLHEIGLQEKY